MAEDWNVLTELAIWLVLGLEKKRLSAQNALPSIMERNDEFLALPFHVGCGPSDLRRVPPACPARCYILWSAVSSRFSTNARLGFFDRTSRLSGFLKEISKSHGQFLG
jgi:hypothetical protein